MPPKQKPGQSKQDYATPEAFVKAVKTLLRIPEFSFDFVADSTNAKAHLYWTQEDDSLSKTSAEWAANCNAGDTCWGWLNPPFAHIKPWVQKCDEANRLGGRIALLVPAAVGSNWFRDHVHNKAQVLLLNGRIPFMPDKPKWLYPKDTILCLYGAPAWYDVWNWRDK